MPKTGEVVNIQEQVGNGFFAFDCVGQMVTQIVDAAIIIGGIILLVYLVWGGLQWMISHGDKANIEKARSTITHAVIGIIIVASSWALWIVALNFFGIEGNICNTTDISTPAAGTTVSPKIPQP
jgi:hypothetical protein